MSEAALLLPGQDGGCLGGSAVEPLSSAQGMIPGSGIESRIRLLAGSLFLPSACLSNKQNLKIYIYRQDGEEPHGIHVPYTNENDLKAERAQQLQQR